MNLTIFPFAAALSSIGYGAYLFYQIIQKPTGNKAMNEIAEAIATGAKAYLARQSKTLLVIASILAIGMWYFLGITMALGFVLGAFASALAGYIGMHTSIRANIRTTVEAKKGLAAALSLAF